MPPTNVQASVMNPFAISHWQVGRLVLVRYSLVDHTNVTTQLNAPHIASRAAVDWSGGALDYSTNLVHWTAVTNAAQTWQLSGPDGLGIFRVRRER